MLAEEFKTYKPMSTTNSTILCAYTKTFKIQGGKRTIGSIIYSLCFI